MRSVYKALLAIGEIAIVGVGLVSSLNLNLLTTDIGGYKSSLSIRSFSAEDGTDQLDFSLELVDEQNRSVATNGTAQLTVKDSMDAVLYQDGFDINETDFQSTSTPSGDRLVTSWSVDYSAMGLSESREGNLVCNLTFSAGDVQLTAMNDSVALPAALIVQYNLYYKVAAPIDQEWALVDGNASGAVTYEPWATYLSQKEVGKVLVWSSDVWPDHPSYVVIINKTWAKMNPDLAARAIKAHMDAEQWIQDALANPGSSQYDHLISVATEMSGWPEEIVTESLTHIKFAFELNDVSKDYVKRYAEGYIENKLITPETLRNRGYEDAEAFADQYLNTSYLEMAKGITPSADKVGNISIGYVKGNLFMLPSVIALDESIWGGASAFEKYGLNVRIASPDGYNTSAVLSQAFMRGQLTFGYIAICPAILQT